ncbi:hypothetical protein [Alkalihalophilus marmarensis]|nr:hypothetical protein [Alkalihalophilus marmarensis]
MIKTLNKNKQTQSQLFLNIRNKIQPQMKDKGFIYDKESQSLKKYSGT